MTINSITLFQGANLRQPTFRGLNISNCFFSEGVITKGDFSFCTISLGKFARTAFTETSFDNAVAENAIFNDARLTDVTFMNARMRGVHFENAKLTNASFIDSELTSGDFSRIQVAGTSVWSNAHAGDYFYVNAVGEQTIRFPPSLFSGEVVMNAVSASGARCKLEKKTPVTANLTGIKLKPGEAFWLSVRADVKSIETSAGTKFYGAILPGADLSSAQLLLCDLDASNFQSAILRNAILVRCRARTSNFTDTDFTGAILDDSDFTGSNFSGANVSQLKSCLRARFNNCTGLSSASIQKLQSHGAQAIVTAAVTNISPMPSIK